MRSLLAIWLAQASELPPPPDITGPLELPPTPEFPWAWILAGGVACVLLGMLAMWLINQASRRPAPSPRSHADEALSRLRALEGSQSELDTYHFSIEVDDVLRDYLSRSLGIQAQRQTSQEFLRSLHYRGGIRESLVPVIETFMEASDAFKFARRPGSPEVNGELLAHARQVVEGSRK